MKIKGSWNLDKTRSFLNDSIYPIRISLIDENGYPNIISLWFIFINNKFWCAVQRDSRVAKLLENSKNCGFEISNNTPPYKGVRGKGKAKIYKNKGKEVLKILIKRYLTQSNNSLKEWLIKRSKNEIAISIDPICFYTWDFSHRMKANSTKTKTNLKYQDKLAS